ncbi:recombination activating protein 1 [Actinacidiphila soli]|uniref:recombination activating protein 1 n=1 Tax=Actinacidiphila soli TaxID=2487275 RepID=UPI000FCCD054|nr:recombination activating protein 1 [Actinacidiphila soli]
MTMRHLVRPRAKCTTCRQDYDEADGEAAARHSEPVDCGQSCRCDGRPRCYTCGGSFCARAAH